MHESYDLHTFDINERDVYLSNTTLSYYDQNAIGFANSTIQADLSAQYAIFMKYLKPGSYILDLGCGSGRDSKYFFIDHKYSVEAIDGSPELCKIASNFLDQPVRRLLFEDIDYIEQFEAVWACSSLLHVCKDILPDILIKVYKALKPDGVIYMSFKYGSFSGERSGRWFTDLTEHDLVEIIEHTGCFKILEMYVSDDTRPGRSHEKWLNVILEKLHRVDQ